LPQVADDPAVIVRSASPILVQTVRSFLCH
jgi:hypothetical protein